MQTPDSKLKRCLMKPFSNFILKLYRSSLEMPTEVFKDWALNECKSLIPFDSYAWASGSWVADKPLVHSVHLHNLDSEFIPIWLNHQHDDKLARKTRSHPDITFNVNIADEYVGTTFYEHHYRHFKIAHVIATATFDTDTLLLNTVCLYRSSAANPFSEADRALKEALFPHIIEAVRINWLNNLSKLFQTNRKSTINAIAACNTMGFLLVVIPSFIEVCRMEWPDWQGPTLPNGIFNKLQSKANQFVGVHIVMTKLKVGEIALLHVRQKIMADELSIRELEVAQRYAAGEDYKTIAQELAVSPSTIKGHLIKIYHYCPVDFKFISL